MNAQRFDNQPTIESMSRGRKTIPKFRVNRKPHVHTVRTQTPKRDAA